MPNRIFQYLLTVTHCTEDKLIQVGFDKIDRAPLPPIFNMADLDIYLTNGKFHYLDPNGKEKQIKNMKQISNLIYGKTQYLR